ncbi:hypothetical protein [Cohnella thailandensis]|uniref:hypothetical protein n=1 Tax=Cohnella thailandensis TaxID=557557 RepID=UPI001E035234|nr:hypothetical protein [Cohnella thailandensis]MBP1975956.1 hypothetical protein [Cohnella thailandensis]
MDSTDYSSQAAFLESISPRVIAVVKPYFDSRLRRSDETGDRSILDDELGSRASCCTTAAAAAFYVWEGRRNRSEASLDIARALAEDVRRRQLPSGGFGQPFYVRKGEPDVVDIAEVGASADSLFHLYSCAGSEAAREALIRSADYLLTQVSPRNPAVILKRPDDDFDVLNGDMYAAHAFGRAYAASGRTVYLEKVRQIVAHLADRFGRNEAGWWPYIENWDGSVFMGNSVAYQATILELAHGLLPLLEEPLRERWNEVSKEAMATMLDAMKEPPSDATEAPWWARDWSKSGEIDKAFWVSGDPEVQRMAMNRLNETVRLLEERGIAAFAPVIENDVPDRTPVTTTYRKVAGFAGTIANMALTEERSRT